MKNLVIPPTGIFWAQMRCWSLCLLLLTLWGGVGIAGICSPFLFGSTIEIGARFSLPIFCLPLFFALIVVWNCYKVWLNRVEVNRHGMDYWTRNGYSFEADDEHLDAFSRELDSLCADFAVAKPRWFVSVRNALFIKIYTPVATAGRPAILITSAMLAADFSSNGRRTLLAHELAHVRLRSQLFDIFCSVVNVIGWSGMAVAAVFVHASLVWHCLLLLLVVPLTFWLASAIGDLLAALISRIHEGSADRIADIVVGQGSIAACMLHLLQAQLSRFPEGQKPLFERRRQPGLLGLVRYLKGELLAEHPHELDRIAASRKSVRSQTGPK